MTELQQLAAALRESRGFAHKADIADVVARLGPPGDVANGDDCAAIPFHDADGDGHLLFAIEGFVDDFVAAQPWFAGWCGVMVNLADIAAMGGRPVAVVDALWSPGSEPGRQVLAGLAAAARAYGVPIVGGHSNCRAARAGLAVAVLGRAKNLLTSFAARPGDTLVMAIDLRGGYDSEQPFWNAATRAPAGRARADFELLAELAESGLADAAKDISMAGAVGTALMLADGSQVGASIEVDAIPRPEGVPLARWLQTFPSFGFVLSLRATKVEPVLQRFAERGIAAAAVGEVDASRRLSLRRGTERVELWNLAERSFVTAPEAVRG